MKCFSAALVVSVALPLLCMTNTLSARGADSAPKAQQQTQNPSFATQIEALHAAMKQQTTAQLRVFYVQSEKREDVIRRAVKFDKADFAAMRAASALYHQISADSFEQQIPAAGWEAEVQANNYASMAVTHHPETADAKQLQQELTARADALVLKTKGTFDPPLPHFTTAAEWKADGNKAHSEGKTFHALQRFQKALEVEPQFADAHNNIGSIYQSLGDYPRALAAFRAAIALDGKHRVAHLNLATSLHFLGFDKEALPVADAALQCVADQTTKISVLALRAQIRLALNNRAGAMEDWRAQSAIDPHPGRAFANIGMVALADGDVKTAMTAFQQSVDATPHAQMFQILNAMALNAWELQVLAEVGGVKSNQMPLSQQDALGEAAHKQLEKVVMVGGFDREFQEYWDETIPTSALARPENLVNQALLRRCNSVMAFLTPLIR